MGNRLLRPDVDGHQVEGLVVHPGAVLLAQGLPGHPDDPVRTRDHLVGEGGRESLRVFFSSFQSIREGDVPDGNTDL